MTLLLAKTTGTLIAAFLVVLHVAAALFLFGVIVGICIALTVKGESR